MSRLHQLPLLARLGDAPDAPPGTSDEWYTPRRSFDAWNEEFGFDLDPCATAESAKCTRYFTSYQDGLVQSWAGARVYCNPPYSNIRPWVLKAWDAVLIERAAVVVLLVPTWSDRAWWQDEVEPFRDVPAGGLRVTYRHGLRRGDLAPRRGASLEVRNLPRMAFGYPGDPEGLSPKAKSDGPKIWPSLLIWRRA